MARAQVALSLANMAALLQAQGKTAAAEEAMRRALSIREDALGPDHPLVRQTFLTGQEGSVSIVCKHCSRYIGRCWICEANPRPFLTEARAQPPQC